MPTFINVTIDWLIDWWRNWRQGVVVAEWVERVDVTVYGAGERGDDDR